MKKYLIVTLVLTAALISGCSENNNTPETAAANETITAAVTEETTEYTTQITVEEVKSAEANDLIIPISEVSDTAKFYTVNVDGTDTEVFAVKDSSGNIKTAFNTCRSCFTSGNGRYELEGKELVCQNCGFHFTADDVGNGQNGGCSPWAVEDGEKEVTDDSIIIPYELLARTKNIFAKWN